LHGLGCRRRVRQATRATGLPTLQGSIYRLIASKKYIASHCVYVQRWWSRTMPFNIGSGMDTWGEER
jgi:hypothetical protein